MADFKISIDTELKTTGIDGQVQEIKTKLENALKDIKVTLDTESAKTDINTILKSISEKPQEIKITANADEAKSVVENLTSGLNKESNIKVNVDSSQVKELGSASSEAASQVDSLAESGVAAGESYAQLMATFQQMVQVYQSLSEQVFEVDEALTEFKKVSDLSGESLNQYVDQLQDLGGTVGRTG